MDSIISELIDLGLGDIASDSRDDLLLKDTLYLNCCKKLECAEKAFNELVLSDEQLKIINEYISCLEESLSRINDISYLAGVRAALAFLAELGIETTEGSQV